MGGTVSIIFELPRRNTFLSIDRFTLPNKQQPLIIFQKISPPQLLFRYMYIYCSSTHYDTIYIYPNFSFALYKFCTCRYYRCNRMLQIWRLFGLLNYFSVFNVNHLKVVDIVKNIFAAAIIINIFSSFIFNNFCYFHHNQKNTSVIVKCRNDSWLYYFMEHRNITNRVTGGEVYVYSVFFVTSLFGNVHFPFIITVVST